MHAESRTRLLAKRRRAFSLAELLLAVLFAGLLLAPLFAFVSGIADLGWRVGEQGKGRSWFSVQNRALTAGFDSSSLAYLDTSNNSLAPARGRSPVSMEAGTVEPGLVSVGVLRGAGLGVRPAASGLVISSGTRLPDVQVPAQPLASRMMQAPAISPQPGVRLRASDFGLDGTLTLSMSSAEGGRVFLDLDGRASLSELSRLEARVEVSRILSGEAGLAWVEFDGSLVTGCVRQELSDGRAQWLLPEAGQFRLVEPSEKVAISYGVDLGAPVLRFNGHDYKDGAVLPIDFRQLLALRSGLMEAKVVWPQELQLRLGAVKEVIAASFDVAFAGRPGPLDGDLSGFSLHENLSLWSERVSVRAIPRLSPPFSGRPAEWVFARQVIPLLSPELEDVRLVSPLISGSVGFVAGELSDLGRLGRLSARAGSVVSTGSRLQLEVTP